MSQLDSTHLSQEVLSGLSRFQVKARRGARLNLDPRRPSAVLFEQEPASKETQVEVQTVFLTGAECSFCCTMCDLWKYTLSNPTEPGNIVTQLEWALQHHPASPWIKLYNASNFFDSRSIPRVDLPIIADRCQAFERVIVENHPRILNHSIAEFAAMLNGTLEVAMGLETIHPTSMTLLNKEFSLRDFSDACQHLDALGIDRRAFVLLQPPGTHPEQSVEWVLRTLEFANTNGVRHCSIIPTRAGNGSMEWLTEQKLFSPPSLGQLEDCLERAIDRFDKMIVTADLWDLEQLAGSCAVCLGSRRRRLEVMNLTQKPAAKENLDCNCVLKIQA
jgi:archaeosine synthase beta-subunit